MSKLERAGYVRSPTYSGEFIDDSVEIVKAAELARSVNGVRSVRNDLQLK